MRVKRGVDRRDETEESWMMERDETVRIPIDTLNNDEPDFISTVVIELVSFPRPSTNIYFTPTSTISFSRLVFVVRITLNF